MSYQRNLLVGGSYASVEMRSVYSSEPTDWAYVKSSIICLLPVNGQTVLFQAIHLSINHLFAHILNVKQFYLTLSVATTPGQRRNLLI